VKLMQGNPAISKPLFSYFLYNSFRSLNLCLLKPDLVEKFTKTNAFLRPFQSEKLNGFP
jgi:hypothetical protein